MIAVHHSSTECRGHSWWKTSRHAKENWMVSSDHASIRARSMRCEVDYERSDEHYPDEKSDNRISLSYDQRSIEMMPVADHELQRSQWRYFTAMRILRAHVGILSLRGSNIQHLLNFYTWWVCVARHSRCFITWQNGITDNSPEPNQASNESISLD